MPETIAFIGLGAMGGGMAGNLLKAGYALLVSDRDPAKVGALVARGARPAATVAEAARQATVTVTMVETTAQTEQVIVGDHGVIGMHSVRQEMACTNAFAAIFLALPSTDGRAGNLANDSGEECVALELNTAFLQRLSRHHEGCKACLHIGYAQTLDLIPDNTTT